MQIEFGHNCGACCGLRLLMCSFYLTALVSAMQMLPCSHGCCYVCIQQIIVCQVRSGHACAGFCKSSPDEVGLPAASREETQACKNGYCIYLHHAVFPSLS